MRPCSSFPSLVLSEESSVSPWDENPDELRQSLANSLVLRDHLQAKFREIWVESYLLSLRESHRFFTKEFTPHCYLKVGSIVLMSSPIKPRPFWNLVKIVEIMPSSDDNIRSVRVQRGDGSTFVAPISKLYPLELEIAPASQVGPDASLDSVDAPSEGSELNYSQPDLDENPIHVDPGGSVPKAGNDQPFTSSLVSETGRTRRYAADRFRQRLGEWRYLV